MAEKGGVGHEQLVYMVLDWSATCLCGVGHEQLVYVVLDWPATCLCRLQALNDGGTPTFLLKGIIFIPQRIHHHKVEKMTCFSLIFETACSCLA